jgi:His-Xaa-Ser system protein HxsD
MSSETRMVSLDAAAFTIDAAQKAAYRFIDRMAVSFQLDDRQIHCELLIDSKTSAVDDLIREFHKELLDQQLRQRIAAETESIRHLILAHAFSKTGLM